MAPDHAGYQLRDGRAVFIRSASAADIPAIAAFYGQLSAESFSTRFLSARQAESVLRQLAGLERVPGTASALAFAADRPGPIIGEARYVPTGRPSPSWPSRSVTRNRAAASAGSCSMTWYAGPGRPASTGSAPRSCWPTRRCCGCLPPPAGY